MLRTLVKNKDASPLNTNTYAQNSVKSGLQPEGDWFESTPQCYLAMCLQQKAKMLLNVI